jgi:hypothetical protein
VRYDGSGKTVWKRMEAYGKTVWKRMEAYGKFNAMIKYMSYNEMGLSIYATV